MSKSFPTLQFFGGPLDGLIVQTAESPEPFFTVETVMVQPQSRSFIARLCASLRIRRKSKRWTVAATYHLNRRRKANAYVYLGSRFTSPGASLWFNRCSRVTGVKLEPFETISKTTWERCPKQP